MPTAWVLVGSPHCSTHLSFDVLSVPCSCHKHTHVATNAQGAPYAYTPFCDTNKETEPYRFWKTGFWKTHLGDKPYHISALYLIDLVRFR
jgi:hypothetical protein